MELIRNKMSRYSSAAATFLSTGAVPLVSDQVLPLHNTKLGKSPNDSCHQLRLSQLPNYDRRERNLADLFVQPVPWRVAVIAYSTLAHSLSGLYSCRVLANAAVFAPRSF